MAVPMYFAVLRYSQMNKTDYWLDCAYPEVVYKVQEAIKDYCGTLIAGTRLVIDMNPCYNHHTLFEDIERVVTICAVKREFKGMAFSNQCPIIKQGEWS